MEGKERDSEGERVSPIVSSSFFSFIFFYFHFFTTERASEKNLFQESISSNSCFKVCFHRFRISLFVSQSFWRLSCSYSSSQSWQEYSIKIDFMFLILVHWAGYLHKRKLFLIKRTSLIFKRSSSFLLINLTSSFFLMDYSNLKFPNAFLKCYFYFKFLLHQVWIKKIQS